MNLLYFNSHTFCARELVNTFQKRKDLKFVSIAIPERIAAMDAPAVFEQFKKFLPAIVVSVNNAGYDLEGVLSDLIAASGSFQVNWFIDDPFYEDVFYHRRTPNLSQRIDFIVEPSFIPAMKSQGYSAHFLPLATDPSFFNTNTPFDYQRDVSFVGNSSLEFLDNLMTPGIEKDLAEFGDLIGRMKQAYFDDHTVDIRELLLRNADKWEGRTTLERDRFLFTVQWLVGYFYRRDLVVDIANRYPKRFTCFGDPYWSRFINPSQVSTDACYYTTLCGYYRSTRINLNINRIQIRTAFNQRVFDCKASRAFLLTERRDLNSRFFKTTGPDRELVEFSNVKECRELIDYFLQHPQERESIALAGRDRILSSHTYDVRMQQMLDICRKEWGI